MTSVVAQTTEPMTLVSSKECEIPISGESLSLDAIVSASKKIPKKASKKKDEEVDDDELEGCEERSEDSDDEGSLVDFIVKGDEEENDDTYGSEDDETPEKLTKEEAMKRDLDGIDPSNIIEGGRGRRVRRKTQRYEEEVFASDEYRKMVLCDVPDDEVEDALGSDDEEEMEDEDGEDSDGSYDDEEDDEEDDDEEDDEEESVSEAKPVPAPNGKKGNVD